MKLSSRKELLKESELTLKQIKKSLNEDKFDKKYIVALAKDIKNIITSYKSQRKGIKDLKGKKELMISMFSAEVAKKIAQKNLIGKTAKQLFWNLIDGDDSDNKPIKSIISADFWYSGDAAIEDSLYFTAEVQYKDGTTGPLSFTPGDLPFRAA